MRAAGKMAVGPVVVGPAEAVPAHKELVQDVPMGGDAVDRLGSSAYSLRGSSISALLCTFILALGPIELCTAMSSPLMRALATRVAPATREAPPA
ncbi:hypothetical protein ZWY2020_022837 [Hordeum vulgare]|nr:hypothetical protein ZWY2020_022837 [Hordeum vulgare]